MEWYLKVFKKYATFKGRARRTEYWMFVLVNFGITVILSLLVDLMQKDSLGVGFFGIVYMLYGLAVLIPGLAVTVRRLHDVGKSGWYIFITLVPLIGGILFLVALFTDSQPGENKYGPNPKESPDIKVIPISKDGTAGHVTKKETPSVDKGQQKISQGSAQEHFQKGWALDQKDKLEEAVQEYIKSLDIDPDYALARSNLGMAYKRLGRQDDAIREWEEALNRGISEVIIKMNTEDWLKEAKALRDEKLKPIDDIDGAVRSYIDELGKASDKWFVAYEALARIGAPAVEPLVHGLKSENELLRNRSIDLLAKIGDKRAVAPLEAAAKISESDFRTITKITGKTFTANIGGMQIQREFSKMLDEYRRLALEAAKKIEK